MTDFQAAKNFPLSHPTPIDELQLAAKFEADLRASGVSSIMIPGILSAAFMASLINLPHEQRVRALQMHLAGVRSVLQAVLGAEQAPDGPLEAL